MSSDDIDYYRRRAEDELDSAQRATDPTVVKVHYEMLSRYLDLIYPQREPVIE